MTQEAIVQTNETELSGKERDKAARELLASFDETLLGLPQFREAAAKSFLGYRGDTTSNEASFKTPSGDYLVNSEKRRLLGRHFYGLSLFQRGNVQDDGSSETVSIRVSAGDYSDEIFYDSIKRNRHGDDTRESFTNNRAAVDKVKALIVQI